MQSWCARFVMRGRQLQCGQSTDKILMLLLPDLKPDYFVCSSKARHKSSTHPLSTGDQHRYLGGEGARDLGATHINTSVDSKPASQPAHKQSQYQLLQAASIHRDSFYRKFPTGEDNSRETSVAFGD